MNGADQARSAFAKGYGGTPVCVGYAPGRINIIGEHTDHAAGLAMPSAIDRGTWIALAPGTVVEAHSLHHEQSWSIPTSGREPSWFTYVRGTAEALSRSGQAVGGFRATIAGNLPLGSGLSSSASLVVALLVGLRRLFDLKLDDMDLLRLCRAVEAEWAGVPCGLLDPLASLHSVDGHVLLVDFAAEEWSPLPWTLGEWRWVAAHSGVERRLSGTGYADRVAGCSEALTAVIDANSDVTGWQDVKREHLAGLDPNLERLGRHVIHENGRVMSAAQSLSLRDAAGLGALLLESHASLRNDFEVSTGELDHLVHAAQHLPGCVGSRMMGGGFGGCTLNLVHRDAVDEFTAALRGVDGKRPRSFVLIPSGGARVM